MPLPGTLLLASSPTPGPQFQIKVPFHLFMQTIKPLLFIYVLKSFLKILTNCSVYSMDSLSLPLILTFLINLSFVVSMEFFFFFQKLCIFQKTTFLKIDIFCGDNQQKTIYVLLFDLHVESLELFTFSNKYMNRNIHSQMQSQIRNIFYFWVTSKLQIEKLTPNFELHKKLSSKMTSLGERKKKIFCN